MPSGDAPECSCCVGLKSLDQRGPPLANMETTSGAMVRWSMQRAARMAEGCTDYQAFWD